jgi:hypothetical protein
MGILHLEMVYESTLWKQQKNFAGRPSSDYLSPFVSGLTLITVNLVYDPFPGPLPSRANCKLLEERELFDYSVHMSQHESTKGSL